MGRDPNQSWLLKKENESEEYESSNGRLQIDPWSLGLANQVWANACNSCLMDSARLFWCEVDDT
jgi:hypothetical protein